MKPKSALRHILCIASSALLTITYAHAATLYWDNNATTAGYGTAGGTWAAPTANQWTTSINGTATPVASLTTATTDTLSFGNGSLATVLDAGTITVSGTVDAGNLTFALGSGAIVLSASGTINLAAASTITLNNAADTISSVLQGAATSLTKAGTGTLTLNGAANTYTGSTLLNGGTLALSGDTATIAGTTGITFNSGGLTLTNTNATQAALDRVPSVGVTSNGGTLTFANTPGANLNYAETIGSIALTSGQLNLVLNTNQNNATNNSQLLAISGLTPPANTSAVTFSAATTGPQAAGGDNIIRVNGITTSTAAGKIVGPWATLGTAANAQNDYAIYNSDTTDGFVVPAAIPAVAETGWTIATDAYTADDGLGGVRLTGTRNITALKSISAATVVTPDFANGVINFANHTFVDGDAVVFNNATTVPAGLTLGTVYFVRDAVALTSFKLAATQGGTAISFTTNGASVSAVGALLTSTGNNLGTTGILNASSNTMYVAATGTGAVTLPSTTAANLHVTAGVGPIVFPAPITDNTVSGVLTLVKNGSGALTLSGNNTFTGGLVNNAGGTTTLSGTNTFGSGGVTINGGVVIFSTIASWGGATRNVTFGGPATLNSSVDGYSGGALTVNAGAVATIATGSVAFASTTGPGTLIAAPNQNKLINIGNASSFTGTLQGRMAINNSHGTNVSLQFSGLADTAGSALQFLQAAGPVNNDSGHDFTIAYNGASALIFNNRQVQILDRVAGNWEIENNGLSNNSGNAAHTWVINTDLLNLGGRVIGAGFQTARILNLGGSNIGDNAFNGKITDGVVVGTAFNVAKSGNGKWILSGNNTYTGNTTVSGGTLVLSGTNSYNGSTSISGGTLIGTNATQSFGTNLSGITIAAVGTLSLRNDSSVAFTNGTSAYNIANSASGATINVDRVTGTGTNTITVGNLTTSSTAATWGLNFTGANGVSLSAGTLTTPASGATNPVHTITNIITGGGSLTLASVFNQVTTPASPNLVFTGTGTTTVTGAITQTLADMDLIKSGVGTLLLNGTNTYTGLTSVNAGTLGGTGAIAGAVTVAAAGSLDPGADVSVAGTLSIGGVLDISAQVSGGAGKLNFALGPIANSDKIALTGIGSLTIGGNVLGFSDFNFSTLSGLQNGTYKLITSANAITGGLDTIPANLTGTIGAGTGILQITGNDVELVVSGIGAGNPYTTWAGSALFNDDANNDGVKNGLAWLLGAATPGANAVGLLPKVSQSDGNLVMTFTCLKVAGRGTALLKLQHSKDLGISDPWTVDDVLVPDVAGVAGVTDVVTFTVPTVNGDPTLVNLQATIPASAASPGTKLFGRLKAEQP